MKISIITINFNNREGLLKTIKSVLDQNFKDLEYLVIDGASTDGSIDVIQLYSDKISYWVSEPDNGRYSAMNKGIRKAVGEYCLFLNSGDWFYNNNVLKDCFDIDFSEDLVYGLQLIKKNGQYVEDLCLDIEYLTFLTLKKSHIPHQCSFIKRELFEKIGFYNEKNNIISDWEFIMIGLFIHGCSLRRISVEMTVYDTTGISSVEEFKIQQNEERRNFLDKKFPLFMPDYDYYEAFMKKWYIKSILSVREIIKRIIRF